MKYIVEFDRMSESIDKLQGLIQEDLFNEVVKFSGIKRKMIWKGQGRDTYFIKYDCEVQKLYDVISQLESYYEFMQLSISKYDSASEEIHVQNVNFNSKLAELTSKKNVQDILNKGDRYE